MSSIIWTKSWDSNLSACNDRSNKEYVKLMGRDFSLLVVPHCGGKNPNPKPNTRAFSLPLQWDHPLWSTHHAPKDGRFSCQRHDSSVKGSLPSPGFQHFDVNRMKFRKNKWNLNWKQLSGFLTKSSKSSHATIFSTSHSETRTLPDVHKSVLYWIMWLAQLAHYKLKPN